MVVRGWVWGSALPASTHDAAEVAARPYPDTLRQLEQALQEPDVARGTQTMELR